ncbi:hypothetical protein U91I_01703 [alpha proteobacterium U9-1i]|nr:hypothetical protein U91I_01703 [alpha proteobacterium U9-1i]
MRHRAATERGREGKTDTFAHDENPCRTLDAARGALGCAGVEKILVK